MLPLLIIPSQFCVPVEVRPPAIVRIADIVVGLTTIEQFEKRYGKGLRMVGGHPSSQGAWYDPTRGIAIYADGFNYSGAGEVLEGVSIYWESSTKVPAKIPRIRLKLAKTDLLQKLKPGMSSPKVARALGRKDIKLEWTEKGLIRYSDKLMNKDNDRYTTWSIKLGFGPKGLDKLNVSAD